MEHTKEHNHPHTHPHEHPYAGSACSDGIEEKSYEEIKALLNFMVQHNAHHTEELEDLLALLPEKVHKKLQLTIGVFDTANLELKEVLELLDSASFPIVTNKDERIEYGHMHSHVHDPREKQRQISRLSRVIGHLEYVKRMLEADEDCSAVLMQISASKSALNGLGKEIIKEHISHCITHAIEEGDTEAVEEFQQAIQKYL
jgi:DNA-binding FrmR family transcriptional regulator